MAHVPGQATSSFEATLSDVSVPANGFARFVEGLNKPVISDADLKNGIAFYNILLHQLEVLGPEFFLASAEVRRRLTRLQSIQENRLVYGNKS